VSLCECGCGLLTKVAPQNDKSKGWVRGQPMRFLRGHAGATVPGRGVGPRNANWRGDEVGYHGLHIWVEAHKPRTGVCNACGATDRRTENANISGEYRRDVEDFIELCIPCHIDLDGGRGCVTRAA
jgi:hypothetical protein